MSDLFRQEVIDRQTNRLHGEILLLPKFSHSLILSLLLIWVVCVVYWLVTNHYARKETVLGWLEPPQGVTKIYAGETGIIKQVLVKEGDKVLADQPLIIVNGDRYLVDGERLESRLLEEYESQQGLLNQQLDRTAGIYQRRQRDVEQQIDAARQDLILLEEQWRTLDERHNMSKKMVESHRSLQKNGHISALDLDNTIAQELALSNEKQSLKREQVNRQNAINQLTTELELLPQESANSIDQLRARLSDVAQQIAQLNGRRAYVIKATQAGLVNNVQARSGQQAYASSSIPLLTIIPNDSSLSAHLLVPVRSVGFIEPGQALDIRYDAFPYQKFGLYQGEVLFISDTVLMPNEVLNSTIRVEEPVYKITAVLDQEFVQAYGKEFSLKPGMTLSADVRLGDRTLLQWLLEPIYSLKGRI